MYQQHNRFMPLADQAMLDFMADNPGAAREEIRRKVALDVSPTTVWRAHHSSGGIFFFGGVYALNSRDCPRCFQRSDSSQLIK